MNILVTGANGQLGTMIREFSEWFPNYGWFFTDVDELDITNDAAINGFMAENKINCIINCAAYTNVDKAEENVELAKKVNSLAVEYLAMAADLFNASLITISTDYVFDGTGFVPYSEEDYVRPIGVYGKTKLEGEQEALGFCDKSIVIRTAWLYSEFGNNFVKTMMRLGKERNSINVVFDQIGTPTYARDLAVVIMKFVNRIERGDNDVWGIYHFSNEGVCSWYDFAAEIMKICGLNCEVLPIKSEEYPTKAKRPHYSVLDKTKIKKVLDIKIPHWRESLENCIQKMEGK